MNSRGRLGRYLHARGMVHKDLKSPNVLVDGHGRAKVALLTDRRKAIIVQYEDVHNIIYSFKIRYDIRNQREI
jgi:serine/threonine protein kinase